MTIDEAIKHCEEVAEQNETQAEKWHKEGGAEWGKTINCRECAADHRQLAEWLTELDVLRHRVLGDDPLIEETISMLDSELKEAKRLLKLAVEQMAQVGEVCDCIHSQDCPLDECGKFTFHNEITKLIEG